MDTKALGAAAGPDPAAEHVHPADHGSETVKTPFLGG